VIFGSGGQVQAKRTGVGQNGQSCTAHPVHPGDVTNCPKAGDTQTYVEVGSYLLNGTQGVTVSQLDPLDNHASATGVIQGAQVTWVATIDQNASMGPLSWYWAAGETGPDQDANPTTPLVGTVPVSCNGLTCAYTPLTSGRMYVQGKLIGLWAHKGSEAVIVTPMSLVASPTTVHANDSVTYTLTVGGGLHSWGWTWTPDPPPVVQPVPGSCVAGTNVCKSKVTASGTEEVTVMMNGQKIKTSAHVVVSP
jgi:hypothetical protein